MNIFIVNNADIVFSLIIAVLAIFISFFLVRPLGLKAIEGVGLTIAGLIFAYARYFITVGGGWSDSHYYYLSSFDTDLSIGFGSDMIFLITRLFSSAGVGFMPTMFIFALLSCLALMIFYSAFLLACRGQPHLVTTLFFLVIIVPSVGFWGGAIGKDGFAVLGTAIFCWALCGRNVRPWPLILGVFLMMIVRPHIGFLMLISISVATIVAKDLSVKYRLPLLIAAGSSVFIILPSLLLYIGVDVEYLVADILGTVESSGDRFNDTGSFISIVDMPIPLRLFSYLFRPLLFEAASVAQLVAAVQNSLLVVFTFYFVFRILFVGALYRKFGGIAMLLFSLAALGLLANVTPNLGIATRQKQMLVPSLLIALIYFNSAVLAKTKRNIDSYQSMHLSAGASSKY